MELGGQLHIGHRFIWDWFSLDFRAGVGYTKFLFEFNLDSLGVEPTLLNLEGLYYPLGIQMALAF